MKKFVIYFVLFVALILAGVFVKRVMGHPEFVVLFHIPGAVFLVLSGMALKSERANEYEKEIELVRRKIENES